MPRQPQFATALRRAIKAARKAPCPAAVGELGRAVGDGRLRQAWIEANASAIEDQTHVDRVSQEVLDWLEAAEYPASTRARLENQIRSPQLRTAKWLSILWAAADRMANNNATKRNVLLDELFRRLDARMMPPELALDDADLRRQETEHAAETLPYTTDQIEFIGKLVHAGIVTEAEAMAFADDNAGTPTYAETQRKIADWVGRIRVPLKCPADRPIRVDVHCRTKKPTEKPQLGKGAAPMATTKKKPKARANATKSAGKPKLWHVGENPAADVVVFRERTKGADVLLVKRKDGRWALPGGFVDKGESRRKAAEREAREEAGIDLAPADHLGLVGRYGGKGTGYDPRDSNTRWVTTEAHAYLVGGRTKIKGGADADAGTTAAEWRPLAEAMALDLYAGHRRILADAVAKFLISPCAAEQVAVRAHCRAKPEKLGALGCPGVADCPCNCAGDSAQLGASGNADSLAIVFHGTWVSDDGDPTMLKVLANQYGGQVRRFFNEQTTGAETSPRNLKAAESVVAAAVRANPHMPIDVFGFSRGGVQAVALANKLNADGIDIDGRRVFPKFRFLGLVDPVATEAQIPAGYSIGTVPEKFTHVFWAAKAGSTVGLDTKALTAIYANHSMKVPASMNGRVTRKTYALPDRLHKYSHHGQMGVDDRVAADLWATAKAAGVPLTGNAPKITTGKTEPVALKVLRAVTNPLSVFFGVDGQLLGKIDDDPQPLVVDGKGKSLHPGDTVEFRADGTLSGKAHGTIARFKFPKGRNNRVVAVVNFKIHGKKIEKIEFKGVPQDEAVGWIITDLVKTTVPKRCNGKRYGIGKRALDMLETVAEFLAEANPIAAVAKLLDGIPEQIPVSSEHAKAATTAALAQIETSKPNSRGKLALDLATELHAGAQRAFADGDTRTGYTAALGMVGALGALARIDKRAAEAIAAHDFNQPKRSRMSGLNSLAPLAGRIVRQ